MLPSLQLEPFPPGEQQLLLRSCPLSPTCGKAQTSPPHSCTPLRGPCRSHSQGRPLGLTLGRAQGGSGREKVGTHHPPPLLCSLSPQPGIRNLTSKPQVTVGWTGWGEKSQVFSSMAGMPWNSGWGRGMGWVLSLASASCPIPPSWSRGHLPPFSLQVERTPIIPKAQQEQGLLHSSADRRSPPQIKEVFCGVFGDLKAPGTGWLV